MKMRTWRITVAEYRNPRRRIIDDVEVPAELEPQAGVYAMVTSVELEEMADDEALPFWGKGEDNGTNAKADG